MYGLIWRILPGPWASKFIMAVGLLAGIVVFFAAWAVMWSLSRKEIPPSKPTVFNPKLAINVYDQHLHGDHDDTPVELREYK